MTPLIRKTRMAWNHPQHAHFLTYSCFRRLPLLIRERTRRWVIDALEGTRQSFQVKLWAYVIMPEHAHVLLYPSQPHYDISKVLVALKRPVSDAARNYLESSHDARWMDRLTVQYPSRRVFRFWQPGGGFDRNIFRDKSISAIINYIENNPVRRGLAATPTELAMVERAFLVPMA